MLQTKLFEEINILSILIYIFLKILVSFGLPKISLSASQYTC